jgi:hypothetical protein
MTNPESRKNSVTPMFSRAKGAPHQSSFEFAVWPAWNATTPSAATPRRASRPAKRAVRGRALLVLVLVTHVRVETP